MAGINRDVLRQFVERDRLSEDDKKTIRANLSDDEELYLIAKMERQILFEESLESTINGKVFPREKRKLLNWINNMIERRDGTGDKNPFEELAAAWTAACERAAEK